MPATILVWATTTTTMIASLPAGGLRCFIDLVPNCVGPSWDGWRTPPRSPTLSPTHPQGVPNNYETDLIFPIVNKAAALAGVDYASADAPTKVQIPCQATPMRHTPPA